MGTQLTRSTERVDTERSKIEESKRAIDTVNGKQKMSFIVREGTTDSKVIDEIIDRRTYQHKRLGFDIVVGDVWLDLGANIGVFSCFVIARGGKVYGYEPEKNNFEILKENIKRTKIEYGASRRLISPPQKEGKVFREGVSTTTGSVKLYLTKNPENKYRHTIIPKKGRDTVTIKVKSMDDILKEHSDINAVKMDIEGAEARAIAGMGGILRSDRPRLAISAYHRPNDLWSLLILIRGMALGYRFWLRTYGYQTFETVLYCVPSIEGDSHGE